MAKSPKQKAKKSQSGIVPILAVGILVSLTFWVPHIDSFNVSKFVVLGVSALALTVMALLRSGARNRWGVGSYAILGFVALLVVNLLTSPNFYKTLIGAQGRNNGVLTYFFLAVIAYLASQRFTSGELPKLLWALTGLGLIQTFYNVLQLAKIDPIKWNNPYGFILGTLGNSDFAAALLSICSVATMWLIALNQKNKPVALGLAALVLIELIVMVQSDVRQSLVLFLFGLSVIVYFELSKRNKRFSIVWIGFVGLGGFTAVLGALQIGPLAKIVFKESITFRGDYWRAAWRMFTDNPVFGVGLGNYGDYFNRYRDGIQVARRGPAVGSDVAHSMPLDFLAMGGLLLGAAYLLLITLSVYCVLRKIKQSTGDEKRVGLVIFSLLGSYLLQSFISIDQIGLAVWGWIFIGVALSFVKSEKQIRPIDTRMTKGFVSVGLVVALVSFLFVSIPTWRADSALKKLAAIPQEQQGIDTRAIRLDQAAKLTAMAPQDSQFKTQVALYLLSNGQAEGIDYAKKALEQNPSDSTALRYLIIAYGQLKDDANLAKYKAEALKIDPFNPELK
jgi:O-antigen ligase